MGRISRLICAHLLIFNIHFTLFGQSTLIGAEYGVLSDTKFEFPAKYGALIFEYNLNSSNFFLGFEPGLIIQDNFEIIGSIPFILKYQLGDLWIFSPEFGAFYWTTRRGGVLAGASLQRKITEKWTPYLNACFWNVYYKDEVSNSTGYVPAVNFGIGIKYKFN